MGLIDSLRHAEQQAVKSVRRGAKFAKQEVQAAEASVLRRVKSRRTANPTPPVSSHADPEQEREASPKPKARTGIVSVNGQDVGEMRCTGR
jgi:hypothetical protein